MDYISKYGEIREKLLSRHFAINEFFRTNYVSDNEPYPLQTYENPLIYTGHLMVCLAFEYQLGNPEALKILRSALESISTIYKFKGNHFDGYFIRWDAVHSNNWIIETKPDGFIKLNYCKDFIRDGAGHYLYVTPFNHNEYSSKTAEERRLYRNWEPSMDELIGLMMGYDVVFRLVKDPEIQKMVKTQANQLGDYLAEYNYMLVRPSNGFDQKNGAKPADTYPDGVGGFTYRGAMNINPAFEYPFGVIFQRITGNPYHSRSSPDNAWEDTVKKARAGIWDKIGDNLSDDAVAKLIAEKTAEGILAVSVGGILGSVLDALAGGIPVSEIIAGTTTVSAVALVSSILVPTLDVLGLHDDFLKLFSSGDLLKTYLIFRDCKDKFDIQHPEEVAVAYLFSKLEPAERFKVYMQGATLHLGKYGNTFPMHLAMSCAPISNDVIDPFVLIQCILWLTNYKSQFDPNNPQLRAFTDDIFVKSVGVLLNMGEEWEAELVTMLDQRYNDFMPDTEFDPTAAQKYLSSIALAWMHAKIRADKGNPVKTPGFTLPVFSNSSPGWSVPGVSKDEIVTALTPVPGGSQPSNIPFNSIQNSRNFWNLEYINGKAPLFLDPVLIKPAEPDDYSSSWPACAFYAPPFIERVAVVQTSREREPDGFAEFTSDFPCESGAIKYSAHWENTSEATRELVVTKNKPLDFRKFAYIFIESSEVLRTDSVKVTLTGQTPDGSQFQIPVTMLAGHSEAGGLYYYGSFQPSNRWSQNYLMRLEIQAACTAEQYSLRGGEIKDGDVIDSDPRSIARVNKNNPPFFPYVDYVPGTDCNHQIEIGTLVQTLPEDELEKNDDFLSATHVSLKVSDGVSILNSKTGLNPEIEKVGAEPFNMKISGIKTLPAGAKNIFEEAGKVHADSKEFRNLNLSGVNDQDYFSIEYSCPESDDKDDSKEVSTSPLGRNKFFSVSVTHYPPCLHFSVQNTENYCVNMEIYQCDEFNKKLYKSLPKTNYVDIFNPPYALGAKKCYLLVKNTDYISQGAFAYDLTIGYTSAYDEMNYKSTGYALTTVARQLLRKYYELIDLPRPPDDLDEVKAVINVGEFIKKYEKFLKDPEVAEMLGQVSQKDSRIALAEEYKSLGKVAQAYNLLDDARRIYLNSSDLYSKVGDKNLQAEVQGNLATIDEKQKQIDNSKMNRIIIKHING